ncbi:Hypothetical protein Cp262_2159 [Corynebacterium pseudotuberculosis]|nr:Hypothetical protein Cp262_2159 [Corynebacterium pseudotuberculosis]
MFSLSQNTALSRQALLSLSGRCRVDTRKDLPLIFAHSTG